MPYNFHTICGRLIGWIGLCGWFLVAGNAIAQGTQSVMLAWEANTEPDIAGYRVHYGTKSGVYTTIVDVGNTSTATISELPSGGTYYFAVSAYDTASLESEPSNEATFVAAPTGTPAAIDGGSYWGATTDGANAYLDLLVTKKGGFTGKVTIDGVTHQVRGQFDANGMATLNLPSSDATPWTLVLGLGANNSVTATLNHGEDSASLSLVSKGYSNSNPAPQQGTYTALLNDATSSGDLPEGSGFAVVSVAKSGNVRATGRLADGKRFSTKSFLAPDGSFTLFALPYGKGKGVLVGTVAIRDQAGQSDGDGVALWTKFPGASGQLFPEGLNGTVSIALSRFQKTSLSLDARRSAEVEPSSATLTGGDLVSGAIQKDLSFPTGNSVVVLNPGADLFALTVNPRNGLVRGAFTHPADGKKRKLSGALFQKTGTGGGYFLGIQTTGRLQLNDLPLVGQE